MANQIQAKVTNRPVQMLHGLRIRSTIISSEVEWENLMMLYSNKAKEDKGLRYVIRDNADEKGSCDLFCGGETGTPDTITCELPEGEYVSVVVTPKWGIFWGRAIDSADRYLRNEWAQKNGRTLDDFRMEIRDMLSSKPSIEIVYRLLPKDEQAQ